ncbi:cytidylate kinase family protein [Candidatus Uhrbacteria bacterium]|nr:cytidylate kinase family protein [Candidatus Uhrbacteria bacterium]
MIITIAGYPGSGKSTVGKILAEKLEYKRYSMGDLQRDLAKKHGMTLQEWQTHEEGDDSFDRELDENQRKLGLEEDNFIVDGRLSWYFMPHSLKIFLNVDPKEGARRIFEHAKEGDRPNENPYDSIEQVVKQAADRVESENKRYMAYHGVHWDDVEKFDLVIDTTKTSPEEVAQQIIDKMAE